MSFGVASGGVDGGSDGGDSAGEVGDADAGERDGDAEGLRGEDTPVVNSTKPVGEGTFSGAASDGGNTVAGGLVGAAGSVVSAGAPGGITGPRTDSMEASVGERPTAKGEASLGTGSGSGADIGPSCRVTGGEAGSISRAWTGRTRAGAGDVALGGGSVAGETTAACFGDGEVPRPAMATAAPASSVTTASGVSRKLNAGQDSFKPACSPPTVSGSTECGSLSVHEFLNE